MAKEHSAEIEDQIVQQKGSKGNFPRINITLSPDMKREWDTFSESIGQTTSGMIRLAVQDYMKREKRNPAIPEDPMVKLERGLENKLNEKLAEFSNIIKSLPQISDMNENKKDQTKSQIIGILEDHPAGVEPKNLSKYCGMGRKEMNDLLAEMQSLGIILIDKGMVKIAK